MARKPPAVVAELGRPATPDEIADRKAENSRRHRASQTTVNLIGATVASLAIVLFLVIVVVRPSAPPKESIDYASIASQAQADSSEPLISPVLPETWTANDARFAETAGVPTWYIGFITPKTQFIALEQGIGADQRWVDATLGRGAETGSATIAGIDWSVFDRRTSDKPGNFAYSLVTTRGGSTIVLHGTAPDGEFEALATAVSAELPKR